MSEDYQPRTETRTILPIYEAIPEGDGPFPTIIQFVHAHGVDDSSKKICNDLARAGYYAVAYDPYLNGSYGFSNRSDDLILKGYDLTYYWLQQSSLADLDRLGYIGFCMGGRHNLLANAYYDHVKAVVSYYGFPHRGGEGSTPQELVGEFTAPVLAIFGSEDRGIPMDAVEAYQQKTASAALDHKSIVYEGAGHGFLNHTSRNHDPEASEKAWAETISFFDKLLK